MVQVRGRQLATILWLQDCLSLYAYSPPKGEKACLNLTVGDVTESSGFTLLITLSEELTVTADVTAARGTDA